MINEGNTVWVVVDVGFGCFITWRSNCNYVSNRFEIGGHTQVVNGALVGSKGVSHSTNHELATTWACQANKETIARNRANTAWIVEATRTKKAVRRKNDDWTRNDFGIGKYVEWSTPINFAGRRHAWRNGRSRSIIISWYPKRVLNGSLENEDATSTAPRLD